MKTPTLSEILDLPDGSYSVSDIQDYFEFIIKIHEKFTDSVPIRIYVNITESKITLKINTEYYLELRQCYYMKMYLI